MAKGAPEVSSVERAPRARATGERPLRRFLELVVLWSFAAAQPLLDVTGRSPETFVFYRVDGLQVVAYALIVLLVVPVVLWLVVTGVAAVSRTAGRVVYAVVAGTLIALIVIQAGKELPAIRGPALVLVAVVVALAVLVFFARSETSRRFVTYLIPAPLVFALLFLVFSPTAQLVRPAGSNASAATDGATGVAHRPVVMLLLDEFPLTSLLNSEGQVDERVYPNFAKLAQSSNWYRNATSINGLTQYAVPSMLTGRYPEEKLAPSYVAHPDNLFSLLAPDYRIRPFETITQLCDPAVCEETEPPNSDSGGLRGLLGQTWDVAKVLAKPYDEPEASSEQFAEKSTTTSPKPAATKKKKGDTGFARTEPNFDALGRNQPDRFKRFLEGLTPNDRPTMHFLHLLLPHSSWRYLPSGLTYPDGRLLLGKGWVEDEWPVQVAHQRHLLQLAYTDRLLGELMDRMKATGLWDDALFVVTADHGNSFIPGTEPRVLETTPAGEAALAWVPMFLKEPGQKKGQTSDANWEHVDLLPTVADALDVPVPFKVDGISQLSDTRSRTDKWFYNDPGDRIEFAGPPAFSIVQQGVTDTLVRGADGTAGLFVTGDRRSWVGKSVASLAERGVDVAGPPSPMTVALAKEVDFRAVDESSGSVPALVWGAVSKSDGRGPVLIAVNGTVAVVSEVFPHRGQPTIEGVVNEELFKSGANDLKLYEVVEGASPQLRPIAFRRQR